MYINWQLRELNLKIVYYGPALSGKTTNLEQIYNRVPADRRSELVSLKTHEDRTLFFDFLQLELGKINGLTPKLHLYTVPGQTYYEASRKLVLRRADGVVFVADSDPARVRDNLESWRNMQAHLKEFGASLDSIALVIQFNKQDLPGALAPTVYAPLMGLHHYPVIKAIAIQRIGVFETLKAITQRVIANVQRHAAPSGKLDNKPPLHTPYTPARTGRMQP